LRLGGGGERHRGRVAEVDRDRPGGDLAAGRRPAKAGAGALDARLVARPGGVEELLAFPRWSYRDGGRVGGGQPAGGEPRQVAALLKLLDVDPDLDPAGGDRDQGQLARVGEAEREPVRILGQVRLAAGGCRQGRGSVATQVVGEDPGERRPCRGARVAVAKRDSPDVDLLLGRRFQVGSYGRSIRRKMRIGSWQAGRRAIRSLR